MGFNDFERKLGNLEKGIKNASYAEENKNTIFEFENFLFMEGLKTVSIINTLFRIHVFCKQVDKPFSKMQKRDIENFIGYLERNVKSENSKKLMRTYLKKFFRWYNGGNEPELTNWFKTKSKRKNGKKLPEQLITTDEVKKMIDSAYYIRDKALIAVLYDTGARISEIGNLKIKDVTFDQYGAILKVNGKTGMRRVRILFSVPYLSNWLDNHPLKEHQDTFIWVTLARQSKGEQINYNSMLINIKRIANRAGIEKRIYNHLFRHSRATELAEHLTQAQMEEHLGWIHGSDMPQTYIHMSGKQVDDAILKMHGLKKDEESQPELTAQQCPRCDEMNGPTSKFCSRCGSALDTQTAMELDNKKSDAMEKLMKMVKQDPELFNLLYDEHKDGN